MKTLPKLTTVDTNKLQPGGLIHMGFAFYNVNSIRGLSYMLTIVCENTTMQWVLPTASKRSTVSIIHFILTTPNNEQQPCKCVRVDEYGALEKSTDVTNLLVDDFNISMETTGGDSLWLNGNNERHNRSIHNMVRAGLLESNKN